MSTDIKLGGEGVRGELQIEAQPPRATTKPRPSHMMAPGLISKLSTKCGKRITTRSSFDLAMHHELTTCKACVAVAKAELEVERVKRGHPPDAHRKYFEWADGPDAGLSSMALVQAVTGARVVKNYDDRTRHPYDPSDFGRCYRVLERFPELRTGTGKIAALSPTWAALVDVWGELEALYREEEPSGSAPKLYARMKELGA
jgi:hypothetical protein